MQGTPHSHVQRQVAKANRRLTVQMLLNFLAWSWAAALLVAAVWFLVHPWLLGATDDWLRWAIAGGIFAVATAAAVGLTWRSAPSALESALELDHRFKLKERATTSLTLAPELLATPAGQALAADAELHVAQVNVRQQFPVRLSWTALLVPAGAVVLTLVALFYNPVLSSSEADAAAQAKDLALARDITEKLKKLEKPVNQPRPDGEKNDQLDDLDELRTLLLQQMLDPTDKDKLRERLQKAVPLEEKLKDRLDDWQAQQDRNKAMKDKLQEMGKNADQQLAKDGPAKNLEDALNKGDLENAQKEIQKLADKLKDNKLTDKDREQLKDQLDDIKKKLDNIADRKEQKDQLQKDRQDEKITKEEFEKKLQQAGEEAEKLKDLKDLSKKIGECKECVAGGDPKDAAKKMAELAKDMKDLDANGKETKKLGEDLKDLQAAREAMLKGLGDGGGPKAGGDRTAAKDGKTGAKDAKQNAKLDDKTSAFRISGEQMGGTHKKIPAQKVGDFFRQAEQDAPGAMERQRVPPDAAPLIRGFYETLNGAKKK